MGKHIVMWIRRWPLVAFYVLCYAITWSLWLPFVITKIEALQLLAMVGVFGGPGIAAILVARVVGYAAGQNRRPPFWLSLAGAWIGCAVIFIAYQMLVSSSTPVVALVIFAMLAGIPAYIIAAALSGSPAVRHALISLVHPRGHWAWYLLALLVPVAMRLTSVGLASLLGWELLANPEPPANLLRPAGSVMVIFLYTLIYAGGLNEETGWTGFALPGFLRRFSPLVSTMLLWALWMLWHVPYYMAGYFDLSPHVLIGSFFGRFLLTWLFIRTKGGVWTAMLLHTSVNVTSQFVPLTNASLLIDVVVAVLVVAGGRLWQRLPPDALGTYLNLAAETMPRPLPEARTTTSPHVE